jgi:hypothetical protein
MFELIESTLFVRLSMPEEREAPPEPPKGAEIPVFMDVQLL